MTATRYRNSYLMPDDEPETVLTFMLADLRHWADKCEVAWDVVSDRSAFHHNEEVQGDN